MTNPVHDDSFSNQQALAAIKSASTVANAVTTGVQTPANAAYNQADQTALANAVISVATQLNALLAALRVTGVVHP
jgi:hypothetical protein